MVITGLNISRERYFEEIKEFLDTKFGVSRNVQDAFRLNVPARRDVLVNFSTGQAKEAVMKRKGEALKDTGTYVKQDLTPKKARSLTRYHS